jgi:hypothetical protein
VKVAPSGIIGVEICGPGSPEFDAGLADILLLSGSPPMEVLRPALPFSVVLANRSARAVAFLGVRFDMTAPRAKPCSVIHYADTLRNPEKADFRSGTARFICAEPAYTALVARGNAARGSAAPDTRGRMNLENLRRMLQIRASLDCVAFDDGQFAGPDTQGAFARLAQEREAEMAFVAEIVRMGPESIKAIEELLICAAEDKDDASRRSVARKLLDGLAAGGSDEMFGRARNHRPRIGLWR